MDIVFLGDDYYRAHGMLKTIEDGVMQKDVYYIYYSETLWMKYFSNSQTGKQQQFTLTDNDSNTEGLDGGNQFVKDISAVYYLPLNYRKLQEMDAVDFEKAVANALLIWEKAESIE